MPDSVFRRSLSRERSPSCWPRMSSAIFLSDFFLLPFVCAFDLNPFSRTPLPPAFRCLPLFVNCVSRLSRERRLDVTLLLAESHRQVTILASAAFSQRYRQLGPPLFPESRYRPHCLVTLFAWSVRGPLGTPAFVFFCWRLWRVPRPIKFFFPGLTDS